MNLYRVFLKNQLPTDKYGVVAEDFSEAEESILNLIPHLVRGDITKIEVDYEDILISRVIDSPCGGVAN